MSPQHRLPPYGCDVLARLQRGENLNVWVYGGTMAWDEAQWRTQNSGPGATLLLPPGDKPGKYHWPVQGLKVMLIWPDGSWDEVHALGQALVQNGAVLVVAPTEQDSEGFLFFRPARKAA